MKTGYIGYAVPSFKDGNDKDGYLMGAGVLEFDISKLDEDEIEYLKADSGNQLEVVPTKIHLNIDQYDRLNGNKFKMLGDPEVHISWEDIKPSLKAAWDVLYKQKTRIFKEIFEVPWK